VSGYDPPWRRLPDGIMLAVRLTPKGGRDAIDGVARLADGQSVLKARVRAAASGGAANEALIRLVAGAVGAAPRDVHLVAGASARLKRLKIGGTPAVLVAALEKICAIG
jgi:uncharacterized protein YggU (UPF0235/DUF167 family)